MQKYMVGAKLAWKQTCQIYLWHDKNMECTLVHNWPTNYHQNWEKKIINIWSHLKFSPSPSCVGLATALVLWLDSVNLFAPENKITLKENICFPQNFW